MLGRVMLETRLGYKGREVDPKDLVAVIDKVAETEEFMKSIAMPAESGTCHKTLKVIKICYEYDSDFNLEKYCIEFNTNIGCNDNGPIKVRTYRTSPTIGGFSTIRDAIKYVEEEIRSNLKSHEHYYVQGLNHVNKLIHSLDRSGLSSFTIRGPA